MRVSIGKPIYNTTVYILDPYLNPLPIGVSGELYIGGIAVARGYWRRPQLSAKTFIANPFSPDPTSRLYKTGDLARYLPNGKIELLGRIDDQVKVRGFRIELGEIEATLRQQPRIKDVIVMVRELPAGDKRLVAYVTTLEPTPSVNQLYDFLKAKLPAYMVPSVFLCLKTFPLTPNGKIDRQALNCLDISQLARAAEWVAPQTETEHRVVKIWSQVLKRECTQISIQDNFFELGGHSLLATQVLSLVRQIFLIDLPLRSLFDYPVLVEWAQRIDQAIALRQPVPDPGETDGGEQWEEILL